MSVVSLVCIGIDMYRLHEYIGFQKRTFKGIYSCLSGRRRGFSELRKDGDDYFDLIRIPTKEYF